MLAYPRTSLIHICQTTCYSIELSQVHTRLIHVASSYSKRLLCMMLYNCSDKRPHTCAKRSPSSSLGLHRAIYVMGGTFHHKLLSLSKCYHTSCQHYYLFFVVFKMDRKIAEMSKFVILNIYQLQLT